MPLHSGRQLRLTANEKARIKDQLAEQGYAMPAIRTIDDYFDATLAAASEDAKMIIAQAYARFLARCEAEREAQDD